MSVDKISKTVHVFLHLIPASKKVFVVNNDIIKALLLNYVKICRHSLSLFVIFNKRNI